MTDLPNVVSKIEDFKERLLEAHDLFSMMEESFPTILARLEKERQQRRGSMRDSEQH